MNATADTLNIGNTAFMLICASLVMLTARRANQMFRRRRFVFVRHSKLTS